MPAERVEQLSIYRPFPNCSTRQSSTVLGAAVAALILLAGQGSCAAEQVARQSQSGEEPQEHVALPPIIVTGQLDSSTTEGTSAYTIGQTGVATHLALALRETPQAVTVLTRQRMDDQQLNSLQAVLENTTGVAPYQSDSERSSFYSRGLLVNNIEYDGIPTAIGNIINGSGVGFLDTAFYDRVEVVRGGSGLLTGTGYPSAAINLVRKRPRAGSSAYLSFGAGSWNTRRGMADLSTALTADGRIRARVVGSYQEGNSYIARYQPQKRALYGIIEADLSPNTTLSLGYEDQRSTPRGSTWGGLPLWFSDGSEASYARSASYGQNWSHWDSSAKTAFATLEHQFDNGWRVRATANQYRSGYSAELLGLLGQADRVTGLGTYPYGAYPVALASSGHGRQNTLDVQANASVELFGRQHDFALGGSSAQRNTGQVDIAPFFASYTPVNVYDLTPAFARPNFAAMPTIPGSTRIKQSSIYSAVRFSLTDPLKLIVGGRYSDFAMDDSVAGTTLHYKHTGEFTPYAGVIYALDSRYSAYASYTDIYNPQVEYRDSKGNVLTPATGKTGEIGLKGAYWDGRLNAALAVFETSLDHAAQIVAGAMTPGGSQAYIGADGTRSRGIEYDLQGELAAGWNVYAGIAHFVAHDSKGAPLNSQLPRSSVQLFSTYRLGGAWQALQLGGGLKWQSRFYQLPQSAASTLGGEQGAYALLALTARYTFSKQSDLAFNLNNALDKKYALQKGDFNTVNYGAPRNVLVTLNLKY